MQVRRTRESCERPENPGGPGRCKRDSPAYRDLYEIEIRLGRQELPPRIGGESIESTVTLERRQEDERNAPAPETYERKRKNQRPRS